MPRRRPAIASSPHFHRNRPFPRLAPRTPASYRDCRRGMAHVAGNFVQRIASRSGLLPGTAAEAFEGSGNGVRNIKQFGEPEDIEHLVDLRDDRTELDIASGRADIFDEAHENAEACGRNV